MNHSTALSLRYQHLVHYRAPSRLDATTQAAHTVAAELLRRDLWHGKSRILIHNPLQIIERLSYDDTLLQSRDYEFIDMTDAPLTADEVAVLAKAHADYARRGKQSALGFGLRYVDTATAVELLSLRGYTERQDGGWYLLNADGLAAAAEAGRGE